MSLSLVGVGGERGRKGRRGWKAVEGRVRLEGEIGRMSGLGRGEEGRSCGLGERGIGGNAVRSAERGARGFRHMD